MQTVIIAVFSWIIGIFGWTQIIGSLQNVADQKKYFYTLIIWAIVVIGFAALVVAKFNGLWGLIIGYLISFIQILRSGKIE